MQQPSIPHHAHDTVVLCCSPKGVALITLHTINEVSVDFDVHFSLATYSIWLPDFLFFVESQMILMLAGKTMCVVM